MPVCMRRVVRVAVRLMLAEDEESRMKAAHFVTTLITSPEQGLTFLPDTHQVEPHQYVKEAISSLSTLHAISHVTVASFAERNEEKMDLFGRCPALPSEGLEALLCWLSKASPVCPAAFEALCSLVPLHDVFEVMQTSQEPEEKGSVLTTLFVYPEILACLFINFLIIFHTLFQAFCKTLNDHHCKKQ